MPHASARRWLWVALLATAPVPYYLGSLEWAPVLRLAFLTLLFGAVMAAEGGGTVIMIFALGLVQALVYTALFRLGADLGARAVARIAAPPLRTAAVGTALLLLFTSSLLPIYDTPLSSARARSTLWQLFE